MCALGCADADAHSGDGNGNGGKPSFVEAVREALRRQWRVKMICKGSNISRAYWQLQLEYKGLLSIQRMQPSHLERARIKAMSSPPPQLARAHAAASSSPVVAQPSPPPPPLTSDELRAARLKYFRQQQPGAAAAAATDVCVGGSAASAAAAPAAAECFKGECICMQPQAAHASRQPQASSSRCISCSGRWMAPTLKPSN